MAGELEGAYSFGGVLAPGERLLWSGAPSGGGQFLASLGGIFGSLIFAALGGAGFAYAIVTRTETGFAACGTFLAAGLVAFGRDLMDGFEAKHLHYAITSARILSVDDREAAPFAVLRGSPEDRMRDAWLDGRAKRSWWRGRRATVKIPYRSFQLGTGKIPDGWQRDWLRLVAVEKADEAVALLNGAGAG